MTSLSTSSVNAEVTPGSGLGKIKTWSARDGIGAEICSMAVGGMLSDCTDTTAPHGRNQYSIFGEWQGGPWGPNRADAETLTENLVYCLEKAFISYDFISFISLMMIPLFSYTPDDAYHTNGYPTRCSLQCNPSRLSLEVLLLAKPLPGAVITSANIMKFVQFQISSFGV